MPYPDRERRGIRDGKKRRKISRGDAEARRGRKIGSEGRIREETLNAVARP